MAKVRAAEGDHDTATRLLDQAESFYRAGFYPDVHPITALRARLQIAGGDLLSAAEWAEDHAVTVNDSADEPAGQYLHEYAHLTLARLLLAQHRTDEVLGLLDRLEAAATAAARGGSLREIRVLQALTHHARGDDSAAVAVLSRSFVDTPEPNSCLRLYLDEGAPMLALLRHAAGAADPVVQSCVQRLLERTAHVVETPPEAHGHAEQLSHRELEVLRLLDSELTGPEIARQLYVSVNTLRTHTKRIFTKLNVTTRAAAVRQAHQQGLL